MPLKLKAADSDAEYRVVRSVDETPGILAIVFGGRGPQFVISASVEPARMHRVAIGSAVGGVEAVEGDSLVWLETDAVAAAIAEKHTLHQVSDMATTVAGALMGQAMSRLQWDVARSVIDWSEELHDALTERAVAMGLVPKLPGDDQ